MKLSVILVVSALTLVLCDNVEISPFTKDVICDVMSRLDKGCSQEAETSRRRLSVIECVAICVTDTLCIGASVDVTGKCFLHRKCHQLPECTIHNSNHNYMARYCVNGEWNSTSRSCDCVEFTTGERCNRYMKHCGGLISPGHEFGDYQVMIDPDEDGLNPIHVVCRTRYPDHWSILMLRNEGIFDFNRTWDEYKFGFYVDQYNMWGGLQAWRALTVAGCTKMTTVLTFQGPPITKVFRTHDDFIVSDESSRYAFTFSGSSTGSRGTPPSGSYYGDCLSSIQNIPFSTWDKDSDGDDSVNCASWAGTPWWYNGCNNSCNLLGYGYDHWFTRPSQELFSVDGVDVNAHASIIKYLTMYLKCV